MTSPARAGHVLAHVDLMIDSAQVSVGCVDWNGRLRTKQIHPGKLAAALQDGVAMTSAIFAPDTAEHPIESGLFHNPEHGYRDAWLKLDTTSLRRDPLTASGAGTLVLGQLEGEFAAYCPRALLARECTRLAECGFEALSAFEFECHLLQESLTTLAQKPPHALVTLPELTRMYSFVDQAVACDLFGDIQRFGAAMAIPLATLHAEFTGLLEASLAPAPPIASGDAGVLYKAMVKAVARRHGALACFMAQLSNRHEAAGAHLNLSLLERGSAMPAFYSEDSPDRLTPTLRHFVAGLQTFSPELIILYLPTINSFKRLGVHSLAPRTNTWGIDNKTVAYRVVNTRRELTRIEIRIPGADVNPYLALAAALAAGRRGLELKLEPSPHVMGNAWREELLLSVPLPRDFSAALAAWRRSSFARITFGAAFVDAFAQSREWQLERFAHAVTDWEVRQFAECV
ncbi:MAG: hypothetical protein HYX63_03485 [Gammaproteobacteria bacterium]|nr:hypothetical protein [Gammaproteobacteria bacterium]